MIKFVAGNMFDKPYDIRVNPVNCVGVMGAGLALEFKKRYPDMFHAYQKECHRNEFEKGQHKFTVGDLHIYNIPDGGIIINLPTKNNWREYSRIGYIEKGLLALYKYLHEMDKDMSVAIPALGCGLGGLKWDDVKPVMEDYWGH